MSIAAVVLAAGASSRLGEPKQLLLDRNGEALVHRIARDALDAGCRPVCVVGGACAGEVRDAVADLGVLVVENQDWSEGLSTSIRCGVRAVIESDPLPVGRIDGLLMLTCDMPSVGRSHLERLMAEFNSDIFRVASEYGNTLGIPAIFLTEDFPALQELKGDAGAKGLLHRGVVIPVPLLGGAFDLDTPDDVARWRATERR